MAKLKQLRMLPMASSYRVVAIGFEQGWAWYNVDSGQYGTTPASPQYVEFYWQQCGFNRSVAAPRPVYVGKFVVTVETPEGPRNEVTVDTLGLHATPESFEAHRAAEIADRAGMIRQNFEARGLNGTNIQFDSYTTLPLNLAGEWTR